MPNNLTGIERQIVAAIVNAATAKGYLLTIADEESVRLKKSASGRAVLNELGGTDVETLSFHDNTTGKVVGWVTFVYGNGRDVMHDWSDNAATNQVVASGLSISDASLNPPSSPNARDRVKVVTGEKVRTFGGWYRHDKVMLDGREIGRIQTRRRNKRTDTITLGPDPSGSPNGGAVLGSDIGWLLRIAGEKA
jgi:hypothetical protein